MTALCAPPSPPMSAPSCLNFPLASPASLSFPVYPLQSPSLTTPPSQLLDSVLVAAAPPTPWNTPGHSRPSQAAFTQCLLWIMQLFLPPMSQLHSSRVLSYAILSLPITLYSLIPAAPLNPFFNQAPGLNTPAVYLATCFEPCTESI
jgi:hypothetical protein